MVILLGEDCYWFSVEVDNRERKRFNILYKSFLGLRAYSPVKRSLIYNKKFRSRRRFSFARIHILETHYKQRQK